MKNQNNKIDRVALRTCLARIERKAVDSLVRKPLYKAVDANLARAVRMRLRDTLFYSVMETSLLIERALHDDGG